MIKKKYGFIPITRKDQKVIQVPPPPPVRAPANPARPLVAPKQAPAPKPQIRTDVPVPERREKVPA